MIKSTLMVLFLYSMSFLANGQDDVRVFDDWQVRDIQVEDVPIVLASTLLSNGQALIAMCLASECYPMVNLSLTCEDDGEYPVLVSADDGIYPFTATCFTLGDRFFFEFPAAAMDIYARSNRFGVAYGMAGGKFKASYFSLKGSTKAILHAKVKLAELESVRAPETKEDSGYSEVL